MLRTELEYASVDPLHVLLYAGHAWNDSERWALLMYVFGDISGDPRDPTMTAACYLAKEDGLQKASAAWREVLDDLEPDAVFHATDFFAGHGIAKGLSNSERIEYGRRLAAIPPKHGLVGFVFTVDNLAFGQVLAPVLREERRKFSTEDLRVFCAMKCISRVAQFLLDANHANPAAWMKEAFQIVLEEEQGFGRYQDFFYESKQRTEKWTWWFGGISPGSKKLLPLQMADLLAHQGAYRVRDLFADKAAAMRPVFAALCEGNHVEVAGLEESDAVSAAQFYRLILRNNPRGLATDAELAILRGRSKFWRRLWRSFRNWLTGRR